MSFLATLGGAFSLACMRRPRRTWHRIGPGQYWLAVTLLGAALALESFLSSPAPRSFDADALATLAAYAMSVLLAAWAVARLLARPALFWPLATYGTLLLLITGAGVLALDTWVLPRWMPERDDADWTPWLLWAAWLLLALRRLLDLLEPLREWPQRSAMALTLTGALVLAPATIEPVEFFYPSAWDEPEFPGADIEAESEPEFDPELVMMTQHERLAAALAGVLPGRPGVIDLYLVAFGSDGSENVFRNEVEYAERLFAQRFGSEGRTLVLVNNPAVVDQRPVATLTNLRRALTSVGERMDRDEDVLVLFATTHGSEEHELYVALDPLPLTQIGPTDLAAALDLAGARYRVAIVSACYSGGFLPALTAPGTLVITAANAEQSSFGCGAESDITYFGQAYLANALNRTGDFVAAFEQAREEIAQWEKRDGYEHSEPQIARDAQVEAQLARWLAASPPGPALEFQPVATR
jgi:hypothetical protein